MEDFVPYELAVKLEQKGFKQGYNIFGYRPIFSDETTIRFISDIGAYENEYFGENITAPTISQVLKWLREEKKIHIIVEIADSGWYYTIYPNIRWEDSKLKSDKYIMSFKNKSSFELAALTGIEYVIDNLI